MNPFDCSDFTRDGVSFPFIAASSDIVMSRLLRAAFKLTVFDNARDVEHGGNMQHKRERRRRCIML